MQTLLLVIHVFICVVLIGLILVQQGKGAEMGAAFGSGASQTLFGSQGSGAFLLKITGLCAALFFATSLALGYLAARQEKHDPLQNLNNAVIDAVTQQSNRAPAAAQPPAVQNPQDQIPQNQAPSSEAAQQKNK